MQSWPTPTVSESTYADAGEVWRGFLQGVGPAGAWCVSLPEDEREVLREAAGKTLAAVQQNQARLKARDEAEASAIHALGWMQSKAYLELARTSVETEVLAPLRARGLEPR